MKKIQFELVSGTASQVISNVNVSCIDLTVSWKSEADFMLSLKSTAAQVLVAENRMGFLGSKGKFLRLWFCFLKSL